MSAEILCRLCPKTGSYKAFEGVSSVISQLTTTELAALLSGLDQKHTDFALAKYCLDESALRSFIAHCQVYAAGLAISEGWHIVKGRPTVYNLGRLVAVEMTQNQRCLKCHGVGFVVNKPCSRCDGTGNFRVSWSDLKNNLLINRSDCKLWLSRYNAIVSYVQNIDSAVIDKIYFNNY